jgi:hypothetical protein
MKSELINVGEICNDLAKKASVTGRWSEFKEAQDVKLHRAGFVGLEDIDQVAVSFEAKRITDEENPTQWPYVSYILRLVATKELVKEELPVMARATIEMAEVSASTSTLVIRTESMPEEDPSEFDDEDDDQYTYERSVQYILDRNGVIKEYSEAQAYMYNDEYLTGTAFSQGQGESLGYASSAVEERVVSQQFHVLEDGVELNETPEALKAIHPVADMRNDLLFTDFLAEHSGEITLAGHSVEEHQRRILAMISFVTLYSDAKGLIQTSFA